MNDYIIKNLWEAQFHTVNKNIDKKHQSITNDAKKIKFEKFLKKYRNWHRHDDIGSPYQFNFYSLKKHGFLNFLKYTLQVNFFNFPYTSTSKQRNFFFDDLEIIKLINSYDILVNCPVHQSPGNNIAYFINKDISANVRWLRYIYFTGVLRNYFKDIENPKFIVDIGSFYGGFQYVMKKTFSKSKNVLVDFPHQLARSAIFLTKAFPESKIFAIYNQQTLNQYYENANKDYDFLFITNEKFNEFSERFDFTLQKIDLVTNFASLGEMNKESFKMYIDSKIMNNSKTTYFYNRYDSSPFYEKTFQEKTTIFDYLLKNHKVVLNRNSGIHAYQMPLRKLFGQKKSRPISSGYFDLIQTKID